MKVKKNDEAENQHQQFGPNFLLSLLLLLAYCLFLGLAFTIFCFSLFFLERLKGSGLLFQTDGASRGHVEVSGWGRDLQGGVGEDAGSSLLPESLGGLQTHTCTLLKHGRKAKDSGQCMCACMCGGGPCRQ